ncbi:MAG: autotransporter outer membrane beta-barrel domain-containing protein, partial [Xanthomonadales bacterium]|nr:autotransporter outer membrane beta-barrel domain-containing protein [Xanthomonadales bacterium]
LSGSVLIEYRSTPTPADAGYHVNPVASVQLPATEGASDVAIFTVDVFDSNRWQDEEFGVRRSGGSFSGDADGTAVMGSIQAGTTELFRIRITGGALPPVPPSWLDGIEDDPNAAGIYRDLTRLCAMDGASDRPECRAFAKLIRGFLTGEVTLEQCLKVMRAVSAENVTAVGVTGKQLMVGQMDNLALRVSTMLQGMGGGFSTSGLALVGGGNSLSLGMLGDVLNAAATDENEEQRTLLGGTRWGVWMNGTIGGGEKTRRRGNAGFDFDTWSLTAGVDYRLRDTTFLGAALGWSKFSSDYSRVTGDLDARSHSLHVYGGYSAANGLSLDGSVSWMRTRYDLERFLPINGSNDLLDGADDIASGRPSANQYSAALGASWYFQRGIWTIAPTMQYEFLRARINAFEEDGDSLFRLAYDEQIQVTRSLSAGLLTDVSLATGVGTFRPYLRALWYSDSGTGARNVMARFVEGGSQATSNSVILREPDRNYGSLELGLGFRRPIGSRTVDFNFGLMKVVQFDALDRWAARLDVRVPF